jgi:hypothetical protein
MALLSVAMLFAVLAIALASLATNTAEAAASLASRARACAFMATAKLAAVRNSSNPSARDMAGA